MEHVLFLFQRSSASGQGVGAGQNFSNWESGRKREEALLSRLSRIIRIVTWLNFVFHRRYKIYWIPNWKQNLFKTRKILHDPLKDNLSLCDKGVHVNTKPQGPVISIYQPVADESTI